jgi:hypothetical protein
LLHLRKKQLRTPDRAPTLMIKLSRINEMMKWHGDLLTLPICLLDAGDRFGRHDACFIYTQTNAANAMLSQ